MIHFQGVVFAALNLLVPDYSNAYPLISLVLACLFLVAVFAMVGYTLACTLRSTVYKIDALDYTRFYFYMTGQKNGGGALSYDQLALVIQIVIGLFLGTLGYYYVTQAVLIFLLVILWLLLLVILRPQRSAVLFFGEVISLSCLIIALIFILVIGIYNYRGCVNCASPYFDGSFSSFAAVMLFFAMLSPLIAVIIECFVHAGPVTRANKNIDIVNNVMVEYNETMIQNIDAETQSFAQARAKPQFGPPSPPLAHYSYAGQQGYQAGQRGSQYEHADNYLNVQMPSRFSVPQNYAQRDRGSLGGMQNRFSARDFSDNVLRESRSSEYRAGYTQRATVDAYGQVQGGEVRYVPSQRPGSPPTSFPNRR